MPDAAQSLIQPVSQKLKHAYLECHSDGHQWRHAGIVGAPEWMPPNGMHGAIARRSVCQSCGAERARWYTRSGEVDNRYRYQDGYLHKRSTPDDYAPSRKDYRKDLVAELFREFEQAAAQAPRRSRSRSA